MLTLQFNSPTGGLRDTLPPLNVDYSKQSNAGWRSIVLKCVADGAPLLCADLKQVVANRPNVCGFAQTNRQFLDVDHELTSIGAAVAAVSTLFIIYIIGTILFYVYSVHCSKNRIDSP